MRPADAQNSARSCFVIMPYGVRDVGKRRVDFDRIYKQIFKPAIRRVRVDGRAMIPLRAAEAVNSRILIHTMLRDLLASRLAVADVSTANSNVHWELGMRHAFVKSGTVLLKLKGTAIPFDIALVMVNEYADTPPMAANGSVGTIASALRETLRENAVDSPLYAESLQLAALMGPPEKPTRLGKAMTEAETAALGGAPQTAAQLYRDAVTLEPKLSLLYVRQGTLFLESGKLKLAQRALHHALALQPRHDDAFRIVKEIEEGRLRRTITNPLQPPVASDLVTKNSHLDVDQFQTAPRGSKGIDMTGKGGFGGGGLGRGGLGRGSSGRGGSGSGGGFGGFGGL